VGLDVHEFKLVYNGKELGLFHRLCDFNIKKESTIHLDPIEICRFCFRENVF